MADSASSYIVVDKLRFLFQKYPQWKATVTRHKHYLQVSMIESELGSIWYSNGTLPFECLRLLESLGWKSTASSIDNGIYTTVLVPNQDINL